MASINFGKISYLYSAQCRPFTDEVEAIHVVPQNAGQHWGEDGLCWCGPERQLGDNQNIPETMVLWIHKKYQPKWG